MWFLCFFTIHGIVKLDVVKKGGSKFKINSSLNERTITRLDKVL